jgi:tetratricopeptide (TPR) repeat protein
MSYLNYSFVACLNRVYIDLSSPNSHSFHIHGVEHTYQNLVSGKPIDSVPYPYTVQVNLPQSFRRSLIKETGLFQYNIDNPLDLPILLHTEKWSNFCEFLKKYHDLDLFIKSRVVNLLKSLCFHELVVEYIPKISGEEIASNSILAGMAFSRAMSSLMTSLDNNTLIDLHELEYVAHNAPPQTQTKFGAALQLVVQYSKTFRELSNAEFWYSLATKELESLENTVDEFTYNRLLSIYYRAVVFVPLLKGDKKEVIRQMNLSEFHAKKMLQESKTDLQHIVANENLNIVYESRTKEALWLGDLELAEELVQKLTKMDPLDPRYQLELGEVFLKRGKIEEATKAYHSATRLGPPGTPIAWFMAGQCHEKLGDIDIAFDCYLTSVQIDELAISAIERLNYLAPRLGNSAIKNWSNSRLQELKEKQKQVAHQPKNSYIPETSSGLKLSGEKALAAG